MALDQQNQTTGRTYRDPSQVQYFLDAEDSFQEASTQITRLLILLADNSTDIRRAQQDMEFCTASIQFEVQGKNAEERKAHLTRLLYQDDQYRALQESLRLHERDKVMIEAELEEAKAALTLHRRRMDYAITCRALLKGVGNE